MFWGKHTDANGIRVSLQTLQPIGSSEFTQLERLQELEFLDVDLPGTYYLEVIEKLLGATTRCRKLRRAGAKIDLSRLQLPMYLLAGIADEVVAPEQLLAWTAGRNAAEICPHEVAPCNHLALFYGSGRLKNMAEIVRG